MQDSNGAIIQGYSHIHMSSGTLRRVEQHRVQENIVIPSFDYRTWARQNENEESLERMAITRPTDSKRDLIHLLTSKRYRRGPRRFFEANQSLYEERIDNAVSSHRPLTFVLPSFPVKCFNPLKVRRRTPDLAEIGCLTQLYSLCREVKRIYEPGAKVILITDGTVYAPIFREPVVHAHAYREGINHLIEMLGYAEHISTTDMSDLIKGRHDEFVGAYNRVEQQVAHYWSENPNAPDRIGLIDNTMTNINLLMYPEDQLIEVFLNQADNELRREIRERATESALEYLVFNQTIREMELIGQAFPVALRVTSHPKEGQLGLNLVHQRSFNFPWNGVGVLRDDGTVRVEFEYEAERNPQYAAVYLQGEDHPFYFKNISSL